MEVDYKKYDSVVAYIYERISILTKHTDKIELLYKTDLQNKLVVKIAEMVSQVQGKTIYLYYDNPIKWIIDKIKYRKDKTKKILYHGTNSTKVFSLNSFDFIRLDNMDMNIDKDIYDEIWEAYYK